MKLIFSLFFFLIFLSACVGNPPVMEYNYANTALESAKRSGAAQYSPGYWHKAETEYRRAQALYKLKEYKSAFASFGRTVKYAEKAENYTRLKKFQSGEGFP